MLLRDNTLIGPANSFVINFPEVHHLPMTLQNITCIIIKVSSNIEINEMAAR